MTKVIVDPDSKETTVFVICEDCEGLGYHEFYYNEYDIYEEVCHRCQGQGEYEI